MEETLNHPRLAGRIRPTLLKENRVESTLTEVGIDRRLLEQVPGLILCPARFIGPSEPLADRAIDMEINHAAANWRRPDTTAKGAALSSIVRGEGHSSHTSRTVFHLHWHATRS
jgi:hypothetical protein